MKYFEWRGEKVSQFVLGAVQLGMDYGVANKTGQPKKEEAFAILDEAAKNGVTMIDTAQAYGNSESVIGQWIKANNNNCPFNIISKWHSDVDINDEVQLKLSVRASVQTLGGPLWGMMIHDEKWLDQFDIIAQVAKDLKKEGVLKYLGASVYSVEAAKKAIEIPGIDFIQVPCNAWDHRMIDSGIFEYAKEHNVLCFVRSVFLQGVLLMNKDELKEILPEAIQISAAWDSFILKYNDTHESMALSFGGFLKLPLVIGVETIGQLEKNYDTLKSMNECFIYEEIKNIVESNVTNYIISPELWQKR